jgi:integrase
LPETIALPLQSALAPPGAAEVRRANVEHPIPGLFLKKTGPLTYNLSQALLGLPEAQLKRRGAQRGSLIVRGKKWKVLFRRHVVDAAGNVQYKATTETIGLAVGAKRMSKTDARAEADRILADANAVSAVPQLQATLRQFVDVRFRPEHIDALTPGGQRHYTYVLDNHVLPSLGDLQLKDIGPDLISMLLASKVQAKLSKQTVVHIRNVISAIFSHAKRLKYWRGDLPTDGVRCHGTPAKEQRSLSHQQLQLLAANIAPPYRPLVTFLPAAGLRIGEALGLRWKNVNMTDQWVNVDGLDIPPHAFAVVQAYSRGQWGRPKTARSRRIIPLSSAAWVALQEMRERDLTGGGDDPVFRGSTGQPWDAHNLAKRFLKPAGAAIGAPWLHWHSLRHTAASLSDLEPAARQKVLGHASTAQTTHYTHPDLEKTRAGLETIN